MTRPWFSYWGSWAALLSGVLLFGTAFLNPEVLLLVPQVLLLLFGFAAFHAQFGKTGTLPRKLSAGGVFIGFSISAAELLGSWVGVTLPFVGYLGYPTTHFGFSLGWDIVLPCALVLYGLGIRNVRSIPGLLRSGLVLAGLVGLLEALRKLALLQGVDVPFYEHSVFNVSLAVTFILMGNFLTTHRDAAAPDADLRYGAWTARIGAVLIVAAVLATLALRFVPLPGELTRAAAFTLALLIVAGAFVRYRGKQHVTRGKAALRDSDPRPPVVFLRPFTEDASGAGQILTAVFWAKLIGGLASTEEQLADAVSAVGPLTAIGLPGETLPTPGAIRVYHSDEDWKNEVDGLLRKARLAIVQPGKSEGVQWELEHAIKTIDRDKLLLLLLHVKEPDYRELARRLHDDLGLTLPAHPGSRRMSGLIEFAQGAPARFLPFKTPFFRSSPFEAMRRHFNHALEPVFRRLNVPWQPSPVSLGRILWIALLGAIALFVLWLLSLLT